MLGWKVLSQPSLENAVCHSHMSSRESLEEARRASPRLLGDCPMEIGRSTGIEILGGPEGP